jgi:hypothetical protein
MTRALGISLSILAGALCLAQAVCAQNSAGGLDITAHLAPTAARSEPVRQFTFYILTKSYADIVKEVEAKDPVPPRDKFIDGLDISKELKAWLKDHKMLDLSTSDLDTMLTPDDIMNTPEFLVAYQAANSGGVTKGIPLPKYKEIDKDKHPDKYEKGKQEFLAALKKFIQQNPATISGIEIELDGVNPQKRWDVLISKHKKFVEKLAPELAQTKYLAAKVDTDLDGHGVLHELPPGNYWISSLNLDANVGDTRVRWDVPVTIQAGQTLRVELSNLNATDTLAASVP